MRRKQPSISIDLIWRIIGLSFVVFGMSTLTAITIFAIADQHIEKKYSTYNYPSETKIVDNTKNFYADEVCKYTEITGNDGKKTRSGECKQIPKEPF